MEKPEPRLNAWRPDLADIRLKGSVDAKRFVQGVQWRVAGFSAPLKRTPRADAPLDSEVFRGEVFTVFEARDDGWSWGQLETDSYVGYVPTKALGPLAPEPTHRLAALRSFLYPGPDLKLPALGALTLGSLLALDGEAETRGMLYRRLAGGEEAVIAGHVVPLGAPVEADYVAIAERFLNTAYLWGGRTSLGVDCSSLVQLSLMMAGRSAPRDTDLQERMLGTAVTAKPRRGDLVFWKGHVAIMSDDERIVHASGHHMAVVSEPLAVAVARITPKAGPPTSIRRL